MRVLLLLLVLGAALSLPFALIKRPWAVKLWRRVRIGFVIYMAVILASALFTLISRWDRIYG